VPFPPDFAPNKSIRAATLSCNLFNSVCASAAFFLDSIKALFNYSIPSAAFNSLIFCPSPLKTFYKFLTFPAKVAN